LRQLGPRPDQAHVTAQNIVKLRKLIELEFAQPESDTGNTAIPVPGETGPLISEPKDMVRNL
jgi:hypothetical protein